MITFTAFNDIAVAVRGQRKHGSWIRLWVGKS